MHPIASQGTSPPPSANSAWSFPIALSNFSYRAGVSPGAAAGAGVGGLLLGVFIGLAFMFLFNRKKMKTLEQQALLVDLAGDAYGSGSYPSLYNSGPTQYHAVPSHGGVDSMGGHQRRTPTSGSYQYHIEPFTMPPSSTGEGAPPTPGGTLTPNRRNPEGKVYVVHHDSQTAPVTIYHEDGTEVVELPPRYPDGMPTPPPAARSPSDGGSGSGSGSGGRGGYFEGRSDITALSGTTRTSETQVPGFLQQPRRPNQPGKPRRNRSPQS